ncbi:MULTISPECIES: alpha/beta hydrolase [unclassified Crossiella]|uniref:alpha/beta hydrolase n=1 Tax=unclassified Crossiella TaxID=2620835 RepID=UPI001FFF34C2|nr:MULTISPECIES: alpha/beta hydrolase [unclassified Crossiella]MCK2243784.1 alpha/beta hydrolase [Crossiella sp. S99.2]MCK2257643.1 alpha/beta hydrolase [Crossiella sp. S99.1]
MSYAIDPELATWLPLIPQVDFADPVATRALRREMAAEFPPYVPVNPVEVRALNIPGPAGGPEVAIRVYTPAGDGPLGALVHIHGGGFVLGDLDLAERSALRVADVVGVVVVAMDYRLAPENPYPAGLEDCYATLEWTAKNAAELGVDPARIAIGGDSAGGGLAAAVTLLARDRGGPALAYQVLNIPELDDRLDTPSMTAYTDTPMWHRPNAILSWDFYLGVGKRGTAEVSPYAAPARATDLSGLPPAFVAVCEFDPLRDEGLDYAQRLVQAGVSTELHLYPGTFHGSGFITEAAVTVRMGRDLTDALRRALRDAPA